MKKSFILMSLVLGALALTSCNNSDIEKVDLTKGGFTFKVAYDTRAGIDNNNVVWQNGDKVAFGAIENGSGATTTPAKGFSFIGNNTFSGDTTFDAQKTYDFYVAYPFVSGKVNLAFNMPGHSEYPDEYSGYVDFGKKSFTQKGQNLDSVMAYAPMFGSVKGASPENLCVTLHHLAAVLDFTVVNNSDAAVTLQSLQMTTPENVKFCGTYYISTTGTITPSKADKVYNTSTVNVTDAASIAKGEAFHVYMPVAPFTLTSGSEIDFKITTDAGVCNLAMHTSADVTFAAGTISTQSLSFTSAAPVTTSTISQVIAGGEGNYTVNGATVFTTSGANVIIGDASGKMLLYKSQNGLAAGDIINVDGETVVFNSKTLLNSTTGTYEYSQPEITKVSSTTINHGTPVTFDESSLSAYKANPTVMYISASGFLNGRSLAIGSSNLYLYDANDVAEANKYAKFDGKSVSLTGYLYGYQDKGNDLMSISCIVNTIQTDSTLPSIELSEKALVFAADEYGQSNAKTIVATATNCHTMIGNPSADWFTYIIDLSGNISIYPNSENQGLTSRVATVSVHSEDNSVQHTVTITQEGKSAPHFTLDLSKDETTSASDDALVWTNTYATITNAKGTGIKATNYYPGTVDKTYTSTRFYTNNLFSMVPSSAYKITTAVFEATSESYATAFAGSTWTNASATANGTTVTVTPTDGRLAVNATIGGTCGFKKITVYYENNDTPVVKELSSIALNGQKTSYTVGDTFSFTGTCTAYYSDGTNKTVTPTSVSSPDMTSAGTKTVNVSYTEGGDTKNTSYDITVAAASSGNKAVLDESEIKANFSNEKRSYGTEVSYVDGAVTWTADCNIDAVGRPWIQIKKDANTAYFKITASSAIKNISLTITSASNSSGGVADITKHTAFSGTIHLKTSPSNGSSDTDDVASTTTVTDNVASIPVSGSYTTLYVKTSAAARIWGVEVTL